MTLTPLALDGVVRVDLEPVTDERGFFARLLCADAFAAAGLEGRFEQWSLSRNRAAGTLRGMHFQAQPFAETKLVRCVRGAIFDVAVDLRHDSPTRHRWVGETLTAENGAALLIPPGFAHGFQTLEQDSDVLYAITPAFQPGYGAGVRWDDPAFAIRWPMAPTAMSARDAGYPDAGP